MYEFRDLTQDPSQQSWLPSVAMEFNGTIIENEIEGYQTLKVSGRETISNELVTESTHVGSITLDNYLPSRSLQITYKLEAKDGTSFQDKFKQLRKVLTTNKEVPIKFADDPNTYYFGRLNAMEVPADDSNTVVSSFTIYCDSPYKFSDLIITNGEVEIETFYKTQPERITLEMPTNRNNIEITNGKERITATGTFNTDAEVTIHFGKEEVRMTVNGVEATYMIDLQSDLENFVLEQGQVVTSPQGEIKLEVRERWL